MNLKSEEQAEDLLKAKVKFWEQFSALCNRHIKAFAEKYPGTENDITMILGELTSIYGRKE